MPFWFNRARVSVALRPRAPRCFSGGLRHGAGGMEPEAPATAAAQAVLALKGSLTSKRWLVHNAELSGRVEALQHVLLSAEASTLASADAQDLSRSGSLCALALSCVRLAGVEDDNVACDADVVEVVAHGVAIAAAVASEFGLPSEFVEALGSALDSLSPFVFGSLRRLDAAWSFKKQEEEPLFRALRALCAWTLRVVHVVAGEGRLSGSVLWAWASGDAVWALVLAKGVLSTRDEVAKAGAAPRSMLPAEMALLRNEVLRAVLGTAAPGVAFDADDDDGMASIAQRNAELIRHRSELASAVLSTGSLQTLVSAASRAGAETAPALASFLSALLQPELRRDLDAEASGTVHEIERQATQNAEVLAETLQRFRWDIWNLLSDAPIACGGQLPRGLLGDCANLAYYCPPTEHSGQRFLGNCLACNSSWGVATDDAFVLASLCVFAANGNLAREGSPLTQAFVGVSSTGQDVVMDHWTCWRGPVRTETLGPWATALIHAPERLPAASPAPQPLAAPRTPALVGRRGMLGDLVRGAPGEFCCALDGLLMVDPVRSPYGHVYERASLAEFLVGGESICPKTGRPLTLASCARDPDLRRTILRWVREWQTQVQRPACESN
mmetsp:Transcript_9180/g.24041  ORF Transcript_9180/g.24041 Transcript_9180/m.24041 type:complete len:614 (-) Transcript_9180:93-1934(-)